LPRYQNICNLVFNSLKIFLICLPDDFARAIRQHYLAATAYVDQMVGKVLTELENQSLVDNTIVVLVGDHGWTLGELGEWSKFSNMETALRVPLLISLPGVTDRCRPNSTTQQSGTY
jgi:iduronate 2-sulfatase